MTQNQIVNRALRMFILYVVYDDCSADRFIRRATLNICQYLVPYDRLFLI